jgi:hypothetical protein
VTTACAGAPNRAADKPEGTQAIAQVEDTTTTTSTPAERKRQEVIDAYLAAGPAWLEAAQVPDPHHPALQQTRTGNQLEVARDIIADMAARNVSYVGPEDSRAREVVTSVRFGNDDPDFAHIDAREVALLEICSVDDYRPAGAETGEIVGDFSVMTVWSRAAMVKEDGAWKLAEWFQDEPILDVDECPGGA